jgi:hypothetical protein
MPETRAPFEDLPILDELRRELSDAFAAQETTAPRKRLRRPMPLVGAGAVVAGAAIAAVLLASPATQPAYALSRHADGTVTVTIHDLATAVPGLNARFAAMGIDETVVPVEANCPSSGALTDELFADPHAASTDTFTFSPGRRYLSPGFTGVIAAEQLSNGKVALAVEAVKPPVPSCFPTTVYTLKRAGSTASGVPIFKAAPTTTGG